jgi:hypothetical protein
MEAGLVKVRRAGGGKVTVKKQKQILGRAQLMFERFVRTVRN